MPFGRLYDDLHKHKKTRKALQGGDRPRDASTLGLWVLANSWCLENYLTDGWVPLFELAGWDSGAEALAARLVAADYWRAEVIDGEDGFRFVDWLERQKSGEQIEAEKEAARNRMRRVRANNGSTAAEVQSESHDPDVDVDKKTSPSRKRSDSEKAGDPFAAFWAVYPKREGKEAAARAWLKAVKIADTETITAGARAAVALWTAENRERQFIPQPATWLNGGRWQDETQTQLPMGEQSRRATLMQCPNLEPHARHQWDDAQNLCHCQGVAA